MTSRTYTGCCLDSYMCLVEVRPIVGRAAIDIQGTITRLPEHDHSSSAARSSDLQLVIRCFHGVLLGRQNGDRIVPKVRPEQVCVRRAGARLDLTLGDTAADPYDHRGPATRKLTGLSLNLHRRGLIPRLAAKKRCRAAAVSVRTQLRAVRVTSEASGQMSRMFPGYTSGKWAMSTSPTLSEIVR